MKFKEILEALVGTVDESPSSTTLRASVNVLANHARKELKRLSDLETEIEDPITVFERWALPPNRGVKHELGNARVSKYSDQNLNAAHMGFMQCYKSLKPHIEALQAEIAAGINTPDVLQNDKIVDSDWFLWDACNNPFDKPVMLEVKYRNGRCEIEYSNFVVWSKVATYRRVASKNEPSANPLQTQVGGSHYTEMAIQPFEFSMRNGLDPCQHTAIKYIARFRQKGGIADLDKAIHTIELLKHFEASK